jgi:hypothetical protein
MQAKKRVQVRIIISEIVEALLKSAHRRENAEMTRIRIVQESRIEIREMIHLLVKIQGIDMNGGETDLRALAGGEAPVHLILGDTDIGSVRL